MRTMTVIVPCYDEQETLPLFYDKIVKVAGQMTDLLFEFLFVDDGSTDQTLFEIKALREKDERVRYISFSRNFGKEAAIFAGLRHAKGDYVVLMDADLQHPPEMIPQMYECVANEGYDCAATRRVNRKSGGKVRSWFSDLFYKLMNKMAKVHIVEGAQDFRVMTRQMVDAILKMPEYNRFSKGIFSWIGFKTKYFDNEDVERAAGKSKWSSWGLFSYSMQGILAFSTAPLTLSTVVGVLFCLVAVVLLIVILAQGDVGRMLTIVCLLFFIGGMQLICLGIAGQYLSKTYLEAKKRPQYIIREIK